MALATVNQRVWEANNRTQTELLDFYTTIFTTDLGFTLFDNDAGTSGWSSSQPTTMSRVFSLQYNAAIKGTIYARVGIEAFGVPSWTQSQIYDSWNSSTNTGSPTMSNNSALGAILPLTGGTTTLVTTYSHPEVKMIAIPSGNANLNFGIVRPANKPDYWSEDAALYAFLYQSNLANELEFATPSNPYIGSVECNMFPSNGDMNDIFAQKPNPYTGRYPVISAPYLFSDGSTTTTRGLVGQFSNDIIIGNSPGLNTIVQINGATTRYRFCTNHSSLSNGHAALGVKIVD